MFNYKLTIQYDGTNYNGWQSQPNGNTIQDQLIDAINKVTREEINLIGSGRTDSGVHALGQVANFKIQNQLNIYRFRHAINSILPNDIAVKDIQLVDENFHSRFDAKLRSYLYFLNNDKSVFYDRFAYRYSYLPKVNIEHLNSLSKILIGEYDFTSFCKSNTSTENKICNVKTLRWRKNGEFLVMLIEANRFLHSMVRTIVGTLLHCVKDNISSDELEKILMDKRRDSAFETAPAKGLFLYKVQY